MLIPLLHKEVSANDDQDEGDGSREAIEEALLKGSGHEETSEKHSSANNDENDGPKPT